MKTKHNGKSEIYDNRTKKNTQITKKNKLQQKNWKKYFKSKKGENFLILTIF